MTWRNFNEIFRKDVTYDNIKTHKLTSQGFTLTLEDTFLEILQEGGVHIHPLAVLGLTLPQQLAFFENVKVYLLKPN